MAQLRLVVEYFHPWTNDTGYQLAQDRGWYAAAGIDVRQVVLDPLFGDSLAHLAAGEADVAVFPTNRLFVRRDRGEPLLGIAAVNHRAMETIQAVAGTGIERPRDLAGRRLALNPTPRGTAMVRHLVAADGGDPDALEIVDSGAREVIADDLAGGFADAFFGGYWAWDALFGSLPPERRIAWPIDEIGAPPFHSYLLGVREELAEADPQLLRAFLAVTERGFRAAAQDPPAALDVLQRTIPYFRPDHLERSLALIAPTWFHDGMWGVHRPELHERYAAWLAEHGILDEADIWRSATTSDLLPATATAP